MAILALLFAAGACSRSVPNEYVTGDMLNEAGSLQTELAENSSPQLMPALSPLRTGLMPQEVDTSSTDNTLTLQTGLFSLKYDLVDIRIEFPQVIGQSDEIDVVLEDKINKTIYEDIISDWSAYDFSISDWGNMRFEIDISYEVMLLTSEYISILYSGDVVVGNGLYRDFDRGVTIDLVNGEKMSLYDFFSQSDLISIIDERVADFNRSNLIEEPLLNDYIKYRRDFINTYLTYITDCDANALSTQFYLRQGRLGLFALALPSVRQNLFVEIQIDNPTW
jgi:hypothetical protein